jgi:hypothetical protein
MIQSPKTRHYIAGNDFGEPRDWDKLKITKNWLEESETLDISISDLEFVRKAKQHLQKRVMNGLTGGVGIFEGEPYTIEFGDPSSPTYIFDGYLDFTNGTAFLGEEEIICSLKKRQGTDWLNDVADGFSFSYLQSVGTITNSDFVKVPYIINYIPDGMQLIILSMSLFMMTKELIENTRKLAETIGDIVDAAVPVVGVGVGVGAVVVTAWDIGNIILLVIKAIAQVIYIIFITIAITKLIKEIFAQLFPKKRYHLGMTFRKLMEKGCQNLGLTFNSSIAGLDDVHIPPKDRKGGESGESGVPINNGPIYTFGNLIRVMKKRHNADYRIVNGVLYFERVDNFSLPSTYVIPEYLNDQERLLDRVEFNTDEIVSNYTISYSLDSSDMNTLDDQTGRIFQAMTLPITVNDQSLVNIQNMVEIDLPFSLGRTKNSLTTIEKVAQVLGRAVDLLTGIFGSGTSFFAQITARKGSLLLSSDLLTIGKIVRMSGGTLLKDQRAELGTETLWNEYHYVSSFAEINGVHNQYFRYKELAVPMTMEQFSLLLDVNEVTDLNGHKARIEKMEYEPERGVAVIDYRINRKFTNNLKIIYV